jgi:hypothetical protein
MITADVVFGNKVEDLDDWQQSANPWTVTLKNGRRRLTVPFFTGLAITDISAADVLECLASDASAGEETFSEFCSNMGYDTDSRRAHKAWTECQRIGVKLRRFLGREYDEIVYSSPDDWRGVVSHERVN